MFTYMAFEGKWREPMELMAKDYVKVSSVRDGIEAERNLQGFFMAYLNPNGYYYTAPELELIVSPDSSMRTKRGRFGSQAISLNIVALTSTANANREAEPEHSGPTSRFAFAILLQAQREQTPLVFCHFFLEVHLGLDEE